MAAQRATAEQLIDTRDVRLVYPLSTDPTPYFTDSYTIAPEAPMPSGGWVLE